MADIDLIGPCGVYCGSCRHYLVLKKNQLEKRGFKKEIIKKFILNYHIYEADGPQITTCIHSQSNTLISSDKKLIKTSRKTGLKTFHVTKDEEKPKDFIK